ncbi:MAG: T9SS type A sorting domain-containing protein [candidate division Zixibacteria bacterium]|nr:T9SS type A sorting domain-containing protein [candidate division Zixibacteria bacterium]
MSNMFGKFILLVVLMLLTVVPFASLEAVIGDWHNFTYSDNSNDITSDGQNIWCATSGGLIKYDTGNESIRKYLNSDGIGDINLLCVEIDSAGAVFAGGSNSTITKIDRDGEVEVFVFEYTTDIRYNIFDMYADGEVLWVATDIGVGQFLIYHNGGEFQNIAAHFGDIPRETPTRAVMVLGDYLWVGTDSGMAYIPKATDLLQDPLNWNTITRDQNGLTEPNILSMTSMSDTLFVGTSNGVFKLDSDSLWYDIGPSSEIIYSLEILAGVMTAATNNGVYQRLSGNWQLMPDDSLITIQAKGLAEDQSGRIWAAFDDGGFASFNDNHWDIFTVPGPASSYINDLAIDSSGNAWLVHANPSGVSKFDGQNWTSYNYQNSGIGIRGAVAVEYDYDHDLVWFGSWGDGLFSFNGNTTWINYDETNSPLRGVSDNAAYVPISDLALDRRGNIWALNLKASNPEVVMAVFDPDDSLWLTYNESPELISDNFQHVIYIHENIVHVCGELQNINRLDFGLNSTDSLDDSLLAQIPDVGQLTDLQMDNEDRLFIGGASGLFVSEYSYSVSEVELPDGHRTAVRSITLDGLGNKWVGTDSGVVVLAGNEWYPTFKTSNSFLLDNSIRSIEIDKSSGLVYIATVNGLSIYESGLFAPSPDLSDMAVYPNPVYAKDENAQIKFLRVPADAEIFIYTASGDLVKEIIYNETNSWDLRNESQRKVAAGIYFFHVQSGELSGSGKFAVIR